MAVIAAGLVAAMDGPTSTDAELAARRLAIAVVGARLLTAVVAQIRPALHARPAAELEALDIAAADDAWKVAAGPLYDRPLSEIVC
jgi:hypothetical protein